MGSTGGNDELVSEESTCSDEGSLLEPPPPPPGDVHGGGPRPPILGGQLFAQARRRLPAAGGARAGHRNVTTNFSLRKPPLPPMGEIRPLRRAPKPPASGPRRAPASDEAICVSSASGGKLGGRGGEGGGGGGGAALLEQGPTRASGGPNPHRCWVPEGRGEGLMWLVPVVRVGRRGHVCRWEWQLP